ncbi:MAG: TRAP transporter small permease [Balneolales bacterium]
MNILIKTLDKILSNASIAIMYLLVFTVLLQIFMRYVVDSPVTFTEELSRYLLVWLGLLAASYAYRQRMHLALDLLVVKLQGKNKKALNIFIHSLIGIFSVSVLLYGGLRLVYLTYILDQHSPALGVSMSIIYLAIPISGIAILCYAIDFIFQELGLSESNAMPDVTTQQEDIHAE